MCQLMESHLFLFELPSEHEPGRSADGPSAGRCGHRVLLSNETDHRVGLSLYRLESVLDGDLDDAARARIEELAGTLLANTVIENYKVDVLG